MNNDGYGPGIGTLIGLKLGSVEANASQHAADLAEVRKQLQSSVASGLFDEAFALAAAEVTAEIVGELSQEAGGAKGVRRLSDPANVEGRNGAYVDRAAMIVRRLSQGHVTMTQADVERIKASRPLK